MGKPRVGVIGSVNVDLTTYATRIPGPGETLEAPGFALGPGGKGANQAVAAARAGADVVMVGAVGDDLFGANSLSGLSAAGVDTTHVRRVAGRPSGVATILVEPNGENRILIVKGANADVSPADIERAGAALRGCDLILLQLEIPLETVYAALAFGKRHGVRTVLNPAPATPDLDLARAADAAYVTPNAGELASLTGLDDVEAGARRLLAQGVQAVIVTRGAEGALLASAAGFEAIPATFVTPLDTTGAGDAFVGSFAAFHAGGARLAAALARAGRYAALSVTRAGAQNSYATLAEFETFERQIEDRA